MPSESGRQHRFMEMVAHNPAAAKRVGVPQKVGEEYAKADEHEGTSYPGPEHHAAQGAQMHVGHDPVMHGNDAAVHEAGGHMAGRDSAVAGGFGHPASTPAQHVGAHGMSGPPRFEEHRQRAMAHALKNPRQPSMYPGEDGRM